MPACPWGGPNHGPETNSEDAIALVARLARKYERKPADGLVALFSTDLLCLLLAVPLQKLLCEARLPVAQPLMRKVQSRIRHKRMNASILQLDMAHCHKVRAVTAGSACLGQGVRVFTEGRRPPRSLKDFAARCCRLSIRCA
jgi:hypothetical protein